MPNVAAAEMIGHQATGAWPNGSRVRRVELGPEASGSIATVVGSVGPVKLHGRASYVYLLEYDSCPGVPVCCVGVGWEWLQVVK